MASLAETGDSDVVCVDESFFDCDVEHFHDGFFMEVPCGSGSLLRDDDNEWPRLGVVLDCGGEAVFVVGFAFGSPGSEAVEEKEAWATFFGGRWDHDGPVVFLIVDGDGAVDVLSGWCFGYDDWALRWSFIGRCEREGDRRCE